MNPVSSLKKRLKTENLDALFVSHPANVSYLSGFSGNESYILVTRGKDFFITDFRYYQQACLELKDFSIELTGEVNHFDLIAGLIKKGRLKRVGFEAKHITYGEVGKIRDRLNGQEFLPVFDFIEDMRVIKSARELEIISRCIQINLTALKDLKNKIAPDKEESEIAALMEYKMKLAGALRPAFDTIVLSGKNCSMPHGAPGARPIKNNHVVLVDSGVYFNGYNSDLTRMFLLGKIPPIINKILSVTQMAQEIAIGAVRPGITASVVDMAARDYIAKKGFARNFGHSLGHGVGREVHEAPQISARSKTILKPGMIFTVEPGIYIPGSGGVRLEDMVLVTEKGVKVLSR